MSSIHFERRRGRQSFASISKLIGYLFWTKWAGNHLVKNGEPLKVKRGCYTMKDIEKVSSGKVKYDSLTGKSIIDPPIS